MPNQFGDVKWTDFGISLDALRVARIETALVKSPWAAELCERLHENVITFFPGTHWGRSVANLLEYVSYAFAYTVANYIESIVPLESVKIQRNGKVTLTGDLSSLVDTLNMIPQSISARDTNNQGAFSVDWSGRSNNQILMAISKSTDWLVWITGLSLLMYRSKTSDPSSRDEHQFVTICDHLLSSSALLEMILNYVKADLIPAQNSRSSISGVFSYMRTGSILEKLNLSDFVDDRNLLGAESDKWTTVKIKKFYEENGSICVFEFIMSNKYREFNDDSRKGGLK